MSKSSYVNLDISSELQDDFLYGAPTFIMLDYASDNTTQFVPPDTKVVVMKMPPVDKFPQYVTASEVSSS